MVASQHPLRIGLTQSGLLPLVASSSQLPYSKPCGLARILSSLFLAHWSYPKWIAPFGRILFAVALPKAP